jgi:hypothetical protein
MIDLNEQPDDDAFLALAKDCTRQLLWELASIRQQLPEETAERAPHETDAMVEYIDAAIRVATERILREHKALYQVFTETVGDQMDERRLRQRIREITGQPQPQRSEGSRQ